MVLRQRVNRLLTGLGLLRHPTKGFWEPTHTGQHLGIDIDTSTDTFSAYAAKLQKLAKQARKLLQRATRTIIWLPVKELHSFVGHAQYIFIAIPAA
jgi:hypothetical protein